MLRSRAPPLGGAPQIAPRSVSELHSNPNILLRPPAVTPGVRFLKLVLVSLLHPGDILKLVWKTTCSDSLPLWRLFFYGALMEKAVTRSLIECPPEYPSP